MGLGTGCPGPRGRGSATSAAADLPRGLTLVAGTSDGVATLFAGRDATGATVSLLQDDAAVWTLTLPLAATPTSVALDANTALLAGSATGSFHLGGQSLSPTGEPGAFVVAVDRATGALRYSVTVHASEYALVHQVASRGNGGALLAGSFRGTISVGETTLTARGATDGFVAALAPTGAISWAVRVGGDGADTVAAVAALTDGGAAIGGSFQYATQIGNARVLPLVERTITTDGFVARIDPKGEVSWTRAIGGGGNDAVTALLSRGDALIIGGVLGEIAPLAGSVRIVEGTDGFVLSMDAAQGRERWAIMVGGAGDQAVDSLAAGESELAVAARSRGATITVGGYRVKGGAGFDTAIGFVGFDGAVNRAEVIAGDADEVPIFTTATATGFSLYGNVGGADAPAQSFRRDYPR